MIPKIIHYCWFGDIKNIPREQQRFIKNWQEIMPDYNIVLWDDNSIKNINIPFVKQAYEKKMYAFVADYIRVYALYHFGGLYLDTDVKVFSKFDHFLDADFFTSYEYLPSFQEEKNLHKYIYSSGEKINKSLLKIPGLGLLSAIIGGAKNHIFLKDCLDFYNSNSFDYVYNNRLIIPVVLAFHAEKYGFLYKDEKQILQNNIIIYPTDIFADYRFLSKRTVAVHYCAGSWTDNTMLQRIKKMLFRIKFVRRLNSFRKKIGS